MSNATLGHIEPILAYCDEHGDTETCSYFNINIETLHRYQRKVKFYETTKPKILLLDMETCFMEVRTWNIGKNYLQHGQIINDWFFLSWSARWLFSNETLCDVLTPEEAIKKDDKRICQSIWSLINSADILIGHNLLKFDLPKLNTRFIMHGFAPPLPYRTIDTLLIARKYFSFSSNRLDYLGKIFRNKGKIKTDFDLWVECAKGNQQALAQMVAYNQEDVNLLENVYIILRPWIKSHPSLPLIMDAKQPACPNCGSFDVTDTDDFYYTPVNKYVAVRCNNCGAPSHKRLSEITPKIKESLLRSDAR
jgi:RNase P subunit RPR2